MGEHDQKTSTSTSASTEEAKIAAREAKWAAADQREVERHEAELRRSTAYEADVRSVAEWRVMDTESRARWVIACERQAGAMERNVDAQEKIASALTAIAASLAQK